MYTHSNRNTTKRFMRDMFQLEKLEYEKVSRLSFAFFGLLILAAIITVIVLLTTKKNKKKDEDDRKPKPPPTPLL
jgi:hypothetical protein